MNSDFINLWITRIMESEDPQFEQILPGSYEEILYTELKGNAQVNSVSTNSKHILVTSSNRENGSAIILNALTRLAHEGKKSSEDNQNNIEKQLIGWLIIDIPISNQLSSTSLVHRIIRRLYFTSVLHGLGELPTLREVVQSLRLNYLQTRGSLSSDRSTGSTEKSGADISASLSLTNPLTVKLTAAEEVSVVEKLSAIMQRADLFESEDQLVSDLQMLAQLENQVNRFARSRYQDLKLPRWEKIQSFFKDVYASIKDDYILKLRPVFVIDAYSPSSSVAALRFLSEATALASANEATLIIQGGNVLQKFWTTDEELGHPIFREQFTHIAIDQAEIKPAENQLLYATLRQYESNNGFNLPTDVKTVLERTMGFSSDIIFPTVKDSSPSTVKNGSLASVNKRKTKKKANSGVQKV